MCGQRHAPTSLPALKERTVPIEYSILLLTKINIWVRFDLIPRCYPVDVRNSVAELRCYCGVQSVVVTGRVNTFLGP